MAADRMEWAARFWSVAGDGDAAFGQKLVPSVLLAEVEPCNQAQSQSRLLSKPSYQLTAVGEYPLGVGPHGVRNWPTQIAGILGSQRGIEGCAGVIGTETPL